MNNTREKRATITLNFKRDSNKKPTETDISLNSKELMIKRQAELRENQLKKIQEQKNQKLINDKKKLEIEVVENEKIEAADTKEIEISKENIDNNLEKKENFKKNDFKKGSNRNFGENNKNNENSEKSFNKFNTNKNNSFNRENGFNRDRFNKEGGFNRDRPNSFNKDVNSFNKDRKDFKTKLEEEKKKKEGEALEIKKKIEQQFELDKKKGPYKEVKTKEVVREFTEDENDNNKKIINKKISKDKTEKFANNLSTYVFNEDGELESGSKIIPSKSIRTNRKKHDKKNANNDVKLKIIQTVNIPDFITVAELANRMNEKKSDLVKKLFTLGMNVNVNQTIDAETSELLVVEFGHIPNRISESDVEKILGEEQQTEVIFRNPVVTVMGHVDHGKTSLLDALRSTKIAENEFGGITQHIGASTINVGNDKFITFIDTPGHEAFTEMRMRGTNVTDIVILVVAADDGIQNQTIEAINHVKAAGVPMIVAINKIDKVDANSQNIKNDLLQHNVILEDFGGEVMSIEVSAKNKINLDKLLETILLQAEMLNLTASVNCKASGAVIESKVDVQKGSLASLLVQKGTLNIGDIVLAGTAYGRIKKMVDDKKKTIEKATPSMVVEILGLDSTPSAGDVFNTVETEKEAREIIAYRSKRILEQKEANRTGKSFTSLLMESGETGKKQLSLIIKTDVNGSIEAINNTLNKLNNEEVNINIIHSAVGAINESDINLAYTINAFVIGFNVRATNEARNTAKEKGIEIKYYSIIYAIIDDVKALINGMLSPIVKEQYLGQAEIRKIFKITNIGKIAGCFVTDGEIHRNANVRLIRDGIVIFDGIVKTLKKSKEDVKEVKHNYECGIAIENYDDIQEKDVIECYKISEEKKVI